MIQRYFEVSKNFGATLLYRTCEVQLIWWYLLFWIASLSSHIFTEDYQWHSWHHTPIFYVLWFSQTNEKLLQICVCLTFSAALNEYMKPLNTLNDLPHFLTSGQQFSRLKGDEVGNWSGLISYLDDGGMKPARNGRKRYKPAQKPLNNTTTL